LIVLDTCVVIFDALTPERLSESARASLDQGEADGTLACCDISVWEIAMLVAKGRLDPGTDSATFTNLALDARGIRVLEITPEIARRSAEIDLPQADPADRLIAATAIEHGASLVTIDHRIRESNLVNTLW
jgi:PIN domain nuclease of toxin-antitoxin system